MQLRPQSPSEWGNKMPLIKGKSQKSFVKNLKTEMHEGKPMKQSLAIAYNMKRKAQKKAHGGVMHYNEGDKVEQPQPSPTPANVKLGSAPDDKDPNSVQTSMRKAFKFAEGGKVKEMKSGYLPMPEEREPANAPAQEEDDKDLNQHMPMIMPDDQDDMVARIMQKQSKNFSQLARLAMGGEVDGQDYDDCEDDMVNRIMHKRSMPYSDLDRYSSGGYVEGDEMYPHAKNKMFDVTNKYSEGGKVANQEHGKNDEDLAGFSPNEFDDLVLRDDLESSYSDDDNSGDALGNKQEDEDQHDIISRIMASRRKKDRMPNPA